MASVAIDYLELWTSAKIRTRKGKGPSKKALGLDRLRTLICDLAMSGALVSSSEAWTTYSLEELGLIQTGNSLTKAVKKRKYSSSSGRPYLGTTDIGYGFTELNYETGVRIPDNDSSLRKATAGSVLICSEGGSAGRKCGITIMDIAFGNKLYSLTPSAKLNAKFLLYFYKSNTFINQFDSLLTGIIGGVSLTKFRKIKISLPTPSTQKLIVQKIDKLLQLVAKLEKYQFAKSAHSIKLTNALLNSLLESRTTNELTEHWSQISDNFENLFSTTENISSLKDAIIQLGVDGYLAPLQEPSGRQNVKLSELLVFGPKNGFSPRSVDFATDVKSLSLSATTTGKFNERHFKYVDINLPDHESELWLKPNDILIQRANSIQYVGVSAIYKGAENKFIYPDLMMKIRTSDAVIPEYLLLTLQSKNVREYYRRNASGTSGSMPKINQKIVNNTVIPLKSLEDQKTIIIKVHELLNLCEILITNLHKSEALKVELAESVVHYASAR